MRITVSIVFMVILLLAYTGNISLIVLIVFALLANTLGEFTAKLSKDKE